jgi:transposase
MCLYVRSLTTSEGEKVQSLLRHSKSRVVVRRAQLVLLSAQGMRTTEIASTTLLHVEYVRELIRQFNIQGLALLKEQPRSGRPVELTEEIKAEIAETAMCPPSLLRQPFTRWSLEKLQQYLLKAKIVRTISLEALRNVLKEKHVSLQRTKTWKESNDPQFESKKNG